MSEAEGGLVNKSIFTVQQHYHKQETTILNDMDSMILNLLSLHNHVGDGKFFTPPWSLVTPLSETQGGVTCLLPPPFLRPCIRRKSKLLTDGKVPKHFHTVLRC